MKLRKTKPAPADRLPPHSIEAEQGVLGCCLLDGPAVGECIEKLRELEVFYDLRHRTIYQCLLKMYEAHEPIELLTVQQRLKDQNELEAVGGLGYLSSLPDCVGSVANLSAYADIVREKYLLRRVIQVASHAVSQIYEHEGEVDTLLDGIERDLLSVNEARVEAKEMHIRAPLARVVEQIENYTRGGPQMLGLPTGIEYLDKMLLGLGPGDLIVIAARPGLGKTSIGVQIIDHIAVEKHVPCGIFTLEMTADQLTARMLFQRARADFQRFRTGYFKGTTDLPKLVAAEPALRRAPIVLDETSGINVLQLRARARRWVHQHRLGCLLVDYLQLMRPSRYYNNREQEVAEMSSGLKSLAKELRIPVIVLAQLNRDIEKAKHRKPQLSDLRESGAVEQDADVVGMLYEPNLSDEDKDAMAQEGEDWSNHARRVNLLVAKQRNGPTGDCKLVYRKAPMRFENAYAGQEPAGCADACPERQPEEEIP